jgi:hypothetical protein
VQRLQSALSWVRPAVAAATPPARATPTAGPTPTPAPTQGALGRSGGIYYDDGREIFIVGLDGSGQAALAVLPPGSDFIPQVANGRLLYYDGNYWLATPQGQKLPVTPPALGPGETIFAARLSPEGNRIAWQLYSPATYTNLQTNLGVSRIVVTDASGGGAQTVMQQAGGATYGDVGELFGWRAGGVPVRGGPRGTLLLQTRVAAVGDGTEQRGLQELDPSIGDLVDDFLPPVSSDLPSAQPLSLSADSRLVTYVPSRARLPSGEGPLPTTLAVLDLATMRSVALDDRANYPTAPDARHPWTRYPFFSQRGGAPISPDDRRVLYTLVDVTYPDGALVPTLTESAEIASLVTHTRAQLADGARAEGWLDASTAIVRKANGLYAVDITGKRQRLIVRGANLVFLGLR